MIFDTIDGNFHRYISYKTEDFTKSSLEKLISFWSGSAVSTWLLSRLCLGIVTRHAGGGESDG